MKKSKFTLLMSSACAALVAALPVRADRLEQMISPAFHPVTFEDPRNDTELRFLYVYHEISDKFITEGGNAQVYALQARYALSDSFSIIATKDGIVDFNPKAAVPKDNGIADIEAGVKYAFYSDAAAGQIASVQLRYLFPVGDEDVFQGQGDGFLHPSVSGAVALTDEITLTAGTGLRIAMDSADSTFWDLDAQVDYRIDTEAGAFYPLVGFGMVTVLDDGKRLPIADEGQDFFSFGSSEASGEAIPTGVAGLRYRPVCNLDLGASFQFPFDNGAEGTRIIDYRWTFDAILRF